MENRNPTAGMKAMLALAVENPKGSASQIVETKPEFKRVGFEGSIPSVHDACMLAGMRERSARNRGPSCPARRQGRTRNAKQSQKCADWASFAVYRGRRWSPYSGGMGRRNKPNGILGNIERLYQRSMTRPSHTPQIHVHQTKLTGYVSAQVDRRDPTAAGRNRQLAGRRAERRNEPNPPTVKINPLPGMDLHRTGVFKPSGTDTWSLGRTDRDPKPGRGRGDGDTERTQQPDFGTQVAEANKFRARRIGPLVWPPIEGSPNEQVAVSANLVQTAHEDPICFCGLGAAVFLPDAGLLRSPQTRRHRPIDRATGPRYDIRRYTICPETGIAGLGGCRSV
jgi:hypothetical protein